MKKTIAEYEKEGYVIGHNYLKIPPQPDPNPGCHPPPYRIHQTTPNPIPKQEDEKNK